MKEHTYLKIEDRQSGDSLLRIQNLSIARRPNVFFKGQALGERLILEDIDLSIRRNTFVALVGESGSGKSILAKTLLGLLSPAKWKVEGNIHFFTSGSNVTNKQDIQSQWQIVRKMTAAIFQEPSSYLDPSLRIGRQLIERSFFENRTSLNIIDILSALHIAMKLIPESQDIDKRLKEWLQRFPYQFSQGQQQRLMWIMAFGEYDLIIADEPTASLDTRIQQVVISYLGQLREAGWIKSMILITHDLRLVNALLNQPHDRVYFLDKTGSMGAYTTVCTYRANSLFNLSEPELAVLARKNLALAKGASEISSPVADEILEGGGIHLEVKNLIQSYKQNIFKKARPAINIEDLCIWRGEIIGIVGESGCGKSTLARAIARLLNNTHKKSIINFHTERGEIVNLVDIQPDGLSNDSKKMREVRAEMQIIFQDAATFFNPNMSLGEVLQETVTMLEKRMSIEEEQIYNFLVNLCKNLNLIEQSDDFNALLDYYPEELSVGQKQRLALVRALLTRPKLLIADEPFTNVDRFTTFDMVKVIKKYRRRYQMTVLVISHDLSLVLEVCDRIVVMNVDETGIGTILRIGSPSEIENSSEPYVRKLLASRLSLN